MANSTITHAWTKLIWHTPKALHCSLALETLDRTSALWFRAILNSEITNRKKHKNAKTTALNRLQKGHLFTMWELKQEGRVSLCLTLTGNVHVGQLKFSAAIFRSSNDCESMVSIDFGVQINFNDMKFINNENCFYSFCSDSNNFYPLEQNPIDYGAWPCKWVNQFYTYDRNLLDFLYKSGFSIVLWIVCNMLPFPSLINESNKIFNTFVFYLSHFFL